MSTKGEPIIDHQIAADDLVRFFRALRPADRRTYDELAARDREHGEDAMHDGAFEPPRGGS